MREKANINFVSFLGVVDSVWVFTRADRWKMPQNVQHLGEMFFFATKKY